MPIITLSGRGGLSYFHWGQTPELAKNKPVSQKLLFTDTANFTIKANLRRKLQTHRCIIPADGFYAWKKVGKKEMIPYRIVPLDQALFSIAGLWEEYEDESGNEVHTFSMIVIKSPPGIGDITSTLPAILHQDQEEIWLEKSAETEDLLSLIQPYSTDALSFFTVSSRILSPDANGPELMKPAPASDQFGNYSLFD
jgi:putative SOS response-associated peptidase YedK